MNNKKSIILFLGFINTNKKIIVGVLILSAIFYWFAWRPAHIRKTCAEQITQKTGSTGSPYWQTKYITCLNTNGLKE